MNIRAICRRIAPCVIGMQLYGAPFPVASNAKKLEKMQERMSSLQAEVRALQANPPLDEQGAILAPASPLVDGDRWELGIEYLFWNTKVEGNDFAYTNNMASSTPPVQGETLSVEPGWTSGLRLYGSRYFFYDRWSLRSRFTYLRPRGSKTSNAAMSSGLIPNKGGAIEVTTVGRAKSEYNLDYYDFDVDLGRDFYVSNNLSIRPFFGVKSLWLTQKQLTRYSGDSLGLDTVAVTNQCKFWGLGTQFGFFSGWHLGRGIRFFADNRVALPYGYYDTHFKEAHSRLADQRFALRDQKHRFNFLYHGNIGIGWGSYVNHKKQYIDAALLYSCSYFLKVNQNMQILDNRFVFENGDIGMQGLGVSFRVSF